MKKISYNELGKHFAEKSSKEFDIWYSEDTKDWEEDMLKAENNANIETFEDYELLECKLEVTKAGKQPLLIDFYIKRYYDDNLDFEYFI